MLPIVYDDLRIGHADAVKWGPLKTGNVLGPDRLDVVMRRHQPALVMHFAPSSYAGESAVDLAKYYGNNIVGSHTFLDVTRRNGVRRSLFLHLRHLRRATHLPITGEKGAAANLRDARGDLPVLLATVERARSTLDWTSRYIDPEFSGRRHTGSWDVVISAALQTDVGSGRTALSSLRMEQGDSALPEANGYTGVGGDHAHRNHRDGLRGAGHRRVLRRLRQRSDLR